MALFLAVDARLSWSLPSINRAVCLPSQASYEALALHFVAKWFCACVHVKKKMASQRKPYSSVSIEPPCQTSNVEISDRLVNCSVENAAVLRENHCERVTQIWTSPSEEWRSRLL